MRSAAVGFQCPSCVSEGARSTRSGRTAYGGKRSTNPALTSYVLIGINVLVFVLIQATGRGDSEWIYRLALLPARGFAVVDGQPMVFDGVANGAWWQLVTSMFTHVEIWHIGFNMLSLWLLGGPLEQHLGRARYLALYLISGLAGSALTYLLAGGSTASLGASGAVFGLFGATAVLMRRLRYDMRPIVALLVINLVITFSWSGIAWQAHIGGLAAGVVIGYAMVHAPRERRALVQYGTCALVLGVVVLLTLVRTAQLT